MRKKIMNAGGSGVIRGLFLICLGLFSLARGAQAAELPWLTDYDTAVKTAQKEHKKIFLLLTGGSWCGVCILAEKNLLDTPEFAQYAAAKLVLLKMTIASKEDILALRVPGGVAKPTVEQRMLLKYADGGANSGVPTVDVLDQNGIKLAEVNTGMIAVTRPVKDYLVRVDAACTGLKTVEGWKFSPGLLSASENAHFVKVQEQVFQKNSRLKAAGQFFGTLGESYPDGLPGTAQERSSMAAECKGYQKRMRLEMLKVDPTLAPIFAKVDHASGQIIPTAFQPASA